MTDPPAPVKVLVADDHGLFRTGLIRMLAADPRFEVVGDAKNGVDAVDRALALRPDVVLMDMQMPQVGGLEAIKLLKSKAPEVQVVVLSAFAEGEVISEAMASGAKGFLNKDATIDEVVMRLLDLNSSKRANLAFEAPTPLSNREMQVLKEVAAGLTNKQIAMRLGMSEKTVRNHLSRVFSKLRATNRTEAVMNAMRIGIRVV